MKKLHNRRSPPGLERVILKKLPKVLLGGFFVPLFMSIAARLLPIAGTAAEIEKYRIGIDILAISLFITVCTAVFTVTIGCIIVVLMKGPAYAADAYELEDSDHPRPDHRKDRR